MSGGDAGAGADPGAGRGATPAADPGAEAEARSGAEAGAERETRSRAAPGAEGETRAGASPDVEPGVPAYPPPLKRSLTLSGHRTSVSLEEPFWQEFRRLAAAEGISVNALGRRIDGARGSETTLASAIRLHVLAALRAER